MAQQRLDETDGFTNTAQRSAAVPNLGDAPDGQDLRRRRDAMSPVSTSPRSKGQIYRYYVSTRLLTGRPTPGGNVIRRVPATAIEQHVSAALRAAADQPQLDASSAIVRVEVYPSCVHVVADRGALIGRPGDLADDIALVTSRLPGDRRVLPGESPEAIRIIVPAHLRRRGGRMLIADAQGRPVDPELHSDPALQRALRSAHDLLAGIGGAPKARPEDAAIGAAPWLLKQRLGRLYVGFQRESRRYFRRLAGSPGMAVHSVDGLAVRVGFEPTVGFPTHAFQACAIDHSATSPSHRTARFAGAAREGRQIAERGRGAQAWPSTPTERERVAPFTYIGRFHDLPTARSAR